MSTQIEMLDGTVVEIPADIPQQYPYQVQSYAESLAKKATDPQVYVYKWTHSNGTVEKRFYSEACWKLETFALEMFDAMCKDMDWYYEYSDDHRVWTKGRDSLSKLNSKKIALHRMGLGDSAEQIFNSYCPKDYA